MNQNTVYLKSALKLQSLDEISGMYEWNKKIFTLNVKNSTLASSDDGINNNSEFSIAGAISAREWTSLDPVAGFGFDLVWASGKIWSFLADNEESCREWVSQINQSLAISKEKTKISIQEMEFTHNLTQTRSPSTMENPQEKSNTFNQYLVSEKFTPHREMRSISLSEEPLGSNTHNISEIPNIESSSSAGSNSSSPQSDGSCSTIESKASDQSETMKRRTYDNNNNNNNSNNKENIRNSSAGYIRDIITTANQPVLPILSVDPKYHDELRLKYFELQRSSLKDRAENEIIKEQLERVKEEMQTRTSLLEDELKSTWDKYRSDTQGIRKDIEKQLLRTESHANSIHKAATIAMTEQHNREMECLREELTAERNRLNVLLNREKQLLDESQARESQLRYEIQSMQDGFQRLESEVSMLREHGRQETLLREKERAYLVMDADQRIQEIASEKDALVKRHQQDIQSKVSEMNAHFEGTLKGIEASMLDTYKSEFEAKKYREIAQIQHQCTKDIEAVRAEERKKATQGVEDTKKVFLDREKQTAEDVRQLELLHAKRIKALEVQVESLKIKNNSLEKENGKLSEDCQKAVIDSKCGSESHKKKLEQHINRGTVLSNQLKEAHLELNASRLREAEYRDKLAKSIEELRIQHAELLEIKKIGDEAAAQAFHWKKACRSLEATHLSEKSALQISRDEIMMLEHELKRLREENWNLQQHSNKSIAKIYGNKKSSPVSSNSANRSKYPPSPSSPPHPHYPPHPHSHPHPHSQHAHYSDYRNAPSPSSYHTSNPNQQQQAVPRPNWCPAGKGSRNVTRSRSQSPSIKDNQNVNSPTSFTPDLSLTKNYSPDYRY